MGKLSEAIDRHRGQFVQPILAFVVTVGFFSVLIGLLVVPDNGVNGLREARLIMLGALQAAFGGVVAFYFGSSKGSSDKDKLLANMPPPVPALQLDNPPDPPAPIPPAPLPPGAP
jgi:hypothetical protein